MCSAYSVRPRPDARVSAPLTWEEIDLCDPADFTMKTMPAWFNANGDRHAEIVTGAVPYPKRFRSRGGEAMWDAAIPRASLPPQRKT